MKIRTVQQRVPVATWGTPRAITIRIKHLSPDEAELERWLKPVSCLRPRKAILFLNPVAQA